MIKSFKCKQTEKIFNLEGSRKLAVEIQQTALRKLEMLDSAIDVKDLKAPPGNKLEKLQGDRKGQHSIRINQKWRICFLWHNGNAHRIEIVDYH